MSLFRSQDRSTVAAVARMLDCNPFVPDRVELERQALVDAFIPTGPIWHSAGDAWISNPNTALLRERVEALAADTQGRLARGVAATPAELELWHGVVLYLLWLRYEDDLYYLVEPPGGATAASAPPKAAALYARFAADVTHFLGNLPGPEPDSPHLFAVAFQARRAFHYTFRKIFGASAPAAQLRAAVWNAIYTRNPARYRLSRFRHMRDVSVLVTGESGTGKELVARAVALSQYLPFDPQSASFAAQPLACFHALNASTLAPTVVEAEFFGHSRGAFTGADSERAGWFETCGPHGTIFLDELGDLEPTVQLKLLRVIENRVFQRMGETTPRRFEGRIVAATNRDLRHEIQVGRFRADLYNRVRTVAIRTPTLRAQLADCPGDLRNLILIAARRAFDPAEAEEIADEVQAWIHANLGPEYPWTGNMRELEQCVRSVIVAGQHDADGIAADPGRDAVADLAALIAAASLPLNDLRDRYIRIAYRRLCSYRNTGDRLGINWRTVKRIVNKSGADDGPERGGSLRRMLHAENAPRRIGSSAQGCGPQAAGTGETAACSIPCCHSGSPLLRGAGFSDR